MHEFIDVLSATSSYLSLWLAAAAIKGFIVLGIATAICLLLRRASASMRHLCWCVAVTAVLLLPVLAAVLPPVQVSVLPTGLSFLQSNAPAASQASVSAQTAAKAPAAPEAPTPSTASAARAHEPAAEAVAPSAAPAAQSAQPGVPITDPRAVPVPPGEFSSGAAIWIFALWAAVAAGILLHFLVGMVGVMRLIRRSTPVTDPSWTDLVDEIGDRLTLRRPVRLLRSPSVKVPMTWGILRPIVLIPESAAEWSDEKRRCVLAHEMTHVKRLDCLTQGIATSACALHWFNPMAWRAAKNLRLEREKACDDSVLEAARAKASDYATHLLDIARSVPDTLVLSPVAVTMATRSQLEGRVLSILDRDRRRGLSRAPAALAIILGACATLTLAAMTPAAAPPKIEPIVSQHPVPEETSAKVHDRAAKPAPADPAPRAQAFAQGPASERTVIDDLIKRSFTVSPGGVLRIDTDRGNIDVRTNAGKVVEVEVRRQTRGRANEKDFAVEFSQSGDAVQIIGKDLRNRNGDDLSVRFIVSVPRQFNVELETAGGNIAIEDLDGTAEVRTAGGNLSFGRIAGSVDASTSGGNVSIDGSDGNVEVQTSGGNIRLGRVGGIVDVRTSGGNISVEEVNGDIEAVTSGGMIQARLARQPKGNCLLKTSGGSITVYLADDIGVDLFAKTSAGYVTSDVDVTVRGEIRPDRLSGTINGGGPELVLDTSAGDVNIRRL